MSFDDFCWSDTAVSSAGNFPRISWNRLRCFSQLYPSVKLISSRCCRRLIAARPLEIFYKRANASHKSLAQISSSSIILLFCAMGPVPRVRIVAASARILNLYQLYCCAAQIPSGGCWRPKRSVSFLSINDLILRLQGMKSLAFFKRGGLHSSSLSSAVTQDEDRKS